MKVLVCGAGIIGGRLAPDAAGEAYRLLMRLGYPVRPAGDEKNLEGGGRLATEAIVCAMAKTRIGVLCTTGRCRSVTGEMEDLDAAFLALRAQAPGFPMPRFDRLRGMMSWADVRRAYGGAT